VDDGYNQLMARFVEQEDAVKAELQKPGQTFEQAKKDCLFAASGCLKFIRLCVSLYIRGAAARPRDAKGEIVADSPTLNEMFKGRNRVDGLAYFRSNQFKEVKGLIRAAEEVLTTHSTHSLTHSTHSYYSLAIRSHTHSPTHTQYPLKYPYTHNAHTQYSHTQHSHIVLTHSTHTQYSHTVPTHSTLSHTVLTHSTHTQYSLTHSHNTVSHTVVTHSTHTQYPHTILTHTQYSPTHNTVSHTVTTHSTHTQYSHTVLTHSTHTQYSLTHITHTQYSLTHSTHT
jgi:hypothetical protein